MYRLQLQDERTVSLHWQIHKDSTSHAAIAERRGERLPVAIAFGCPPAVTYAASAPLPADIDEYLFAGFLAARARRPRRLRVGAAAGAGRRAGRARGLGRTGRAAARGPVRRSHRLLHAGRAVPVRPRRDDDDAQRPDLPVDHRRPSAAGGRPDRQGDRADLPAVDPHDRSGDRRLRPARGGRVPQLRDRLDRQAVPEARAEGDERDLGRRAAVAVEARRGRRRRLRRARLRRGRVAGVRQRRLRARRAAHASARSTISTTRRTSSSAAASSASTPPASCPPRGTGAPAAGRPSACSTTGRAPSSTGAGGSTACDRGRRPAEPAGCARSFGW